MLVHFAANLKIMNETFYLYSTWNKYIFYSWYTDKILLFDFFSLSILVWWLKNISFTYLFWWSRIIKLLKSIFYNNFSFCIFIYLFQKFIILLTSFNYRIHHITCMCFWKIIKTINVIFFKQLNKNGIVIQFFINKSTLVSNNIYSISSLLTSLKTKKHAFKFHFIKD